MSYSKDREEFVFALARRAPAFGLTAIRRILKYAGVLQRCAELDCSVPMNDTQRATHDHRVAIARAYISGAMPKGWGVVTNGDPRGCVVRLYAPGEDMEQGIGIGVPAQGYSARQMERMTGRA